MTDERRDQIGAKRAEMIDAIRDKADRELNDERFAAWRTPSRRRLVIAGWIATVGLTTVAAWFDWPLVLPIGLVAALGFAFLLRRIVRGMADLPDELLDERMLARRNQAYRMAYSGLAVVALIPAVALWLAADATAIDFELEARHLGALTYLVLGIALALPSAILAMTEDEL